MKKTNWLIVGVIGFVILLFLFGGGMLSGWGNRGWGMMGGPGTTLAPGANPGGGYGMMGGWGYSAFPFGWVGMLFMWLVSIGIITLIVLGVVWLVRNVGNSKS
jgi:hypothetical protein